MLPSRAPEAGAFSAAVLAGGESRRMGRDKRAVAIDGVPMLRRAVLAVASVAGDVLVACRAESPPSPEILRGLDVRLVHDRLAAAGPLAGLEAALAAARYDLVLVVAADMPWLEPAVLRLLVAEAVARPEAQIVALATDEAPQPLLAVYRRAALPTVTALLDSGVRPMRSLLAAVPVAVVEPARWLPLDPTGQSARNVNEPGDAAAPMMRVGS